MKCEPIKRKTHPHRKEVIPYAIHKMNNSINIRRFVFCRKLLLFGVRRPETFINSVYTVHTSEFSNLFAFICFDWNHSFLLSFFLSCLNSIVFNSTDDDRLVNKREKNEKRIVRSSCFFFLSRWNLSAFYWIVKWNFHIKTISRSLNDQQVIKDSVFRSLSHWIYMRWKSIRVNRLISKLISDFEINVCLFLVEQCHGTTMLNVE